MAESKEGPIPVSKTHIKVQAEAMNHVIMECRERGLDINQGRFQIDVMGDLEVYFDEENSLTLVGPYGWRPVHNA